MEGVGNHVRDVHQASVALGRLRSKFYLMEGLLEEILRDAVLLDVRERLEEHFLQALEVLLGDALHAEGEGGLAGGVVETCSRAELGSLALLDYRLVEGSIWSCKEKL